MKSRKILLTIMMVLILIISSVNFVYADSVSINMSANKQDYKDGQTVILTVSLSDINLPSVNLEDSKFKLTGTIDYSADVFEDYDITTLNNWKDVSSEEKQINLSLDREFEDNDIMQIALKVKNGAKLGRATVMLSELELTINEEDTIDISPATVSVNIKTASEVSDDDGSIPIIVATSTPTTPTKTPTPITTPTTDAGEIPQTGITDNLTPILFGALIVGLISFVGYRRYKDI